MAFFDSLLALVGYNPKDYPRRPALSTFFYFFVSILFFFVSFNFYKYSQEPIVPLLQAALGAYRQPLGDEPCNSPADRSVWCEGLNIKTDYEEITPKLGVVRNYYVEITNDWICPDGKCINVTLVNGTYPGPTLYGNWGDTFNITVKNLLQNCNGTSIHYHGIRQWFSAFADGVAGVTQCPIKPLDEMTYTWQATQYGSSWYHSHFSLQYANGILGPVVIYGPSSGDYDIDAGPLLLTDWFHTDAFTLFPREIGFDDRDIEVNSTLINGMGNYTKVQSDNVTVTSACLPNEPDCGVATALWNTTVEAGKRYKFRIVNTSVLTHLTFSIDNHTLEVVSTDFVPITPYKADNLTVAIGQRYEVIVTANADTSQTKDFWVKVRNCRNLCAGDEYYEGFSGGWEECRRGILSYNSVAAIPTVTYPNVIDTLCQDIPLASMVPEVSRTVVGIPTSLTDIDRIPGFEVQRGKNDQYSKIKWWSLKDFTFRVNWSDPTISHILQYPDYSTWQPSQYEPVYVNGTASDWVAFMIEGEWAGSDNEFALKAPHPIHLHGHDYVILAQNETAYDPSTNYTLNPVNPPRRDVAMLPRGGFIVLAFRLDNPGPWLMHCHIAFHASAGLALQFVENPADFKRIMTDARRKQYYDQCKAWVKYYNQDLCGFRQEDSGI